MSEIDDHYQKLCKSEKWLGNPIHEERSTPDGTGRYRTYQTSDGLYASIHWTPECGAHETHGQIRLQWERLGFEASFLGYPTTDEKDYVQDGEIKGRIGEFQGGYIVWLFEDVWIIFKIVNGEAAVFEKQKTTQQQIEDAAKQIGGILRILREAAGY